MQSGLYFEYYFKDGKQYTKLKISMYLWQLLSWLIIVSISKVILAFVQLSQSKNLEKLGSSILSPFKNPKLKLLIVMIFVPLIMNSIQFWVQDNFLKLKKEIYPQLEVNKSNQLDYIGQKDSTTIEKVSNVEINLDVSDEEKKQKKSNLNNSISSV